MIRIAENKDIEQINRLREQVNDIHVQGRPDIFKAGFLRIRRVSCISQIPGMRSVMFLRAAVRLFGSKIQQHPVCIAESL